MRGFRYFLVVLAAIAGLSLGAKLGGEHVVWLRSGSRIGNRIRLAVGMNGFAELRAVHQIAGTGAEHGTARRGDFRTRRGGRDDGERIRPAVVDRRCRQCRGAGEMPDAVR